MAELSGNGGELLAVITIKRAATGKEETYNLILRPEPEKPEGEVNGTDTLDDGAGRSD
jgi:hypothetical protein